MRSIFVGDCIIAPTKPKIANFELTICVDKQISWLQIAVDNTSRVYVFHASKDLIGEILDVLVSERLPRSDDLMKVS